MAKKAAAVPFALDFGKLVGLVPMITGFIQSIQQMQPDLPGDEKKALVLDWTKQAITMTEMFTGDIVNDQLLLDAVGEVIDTTVAALKATAVLTALVLDIQTKQQARQQG
jgi:hypothetical protein